MKECNRCNKLKTEENFCFRNKSKNQRQNTCKTCTRKAIRKHYQENKDYYLEKAKKRNKAKREEIRKFIYHFLLNNPCIDCGESDPVVLEFDHVGSKNNEVSVIMKNLNLNKIKEEIKKCVVRCANCHRRKTAKDFNWYKLNMHP